MHNFKSTKSQENEKTSFDRRRLSLNHEVCFLLQAKADVNQIHFSWNLLFQSLPSVVSAYMAPGLARTNPNQPEHNRATKYWARAKKQNRERRKEKQLQT